MPIIRGRLFHPDATTWSGYRVTAAWTTRATDAEPAEARFRSVATTTEGRFSLDSPGRGEIDRAFDLAVNAPGGQLVYSDQIEAGAARVLELRTTMYIPPVVADAALPPDAIRPQRLSGRAMAHSGQPARAGDTVVLWGVGESGSNADAWPFLVARIQSAGYFAGERSTRTFGRAFGTVGGNPAIPISLSDGQVPEKVVLVGDVPTGAVKDADCDCAKLSPPRLATHDELTANPEVFASDLGGRCVDLTIPNRALEEVTWYAVVRTSQPTIRAFTLEEQRPLPNSLVQNLVDVTTRGATRFTVAAARPGGDGQDAAPRLVPDALVLDAREAGRTLRAGETLTPAGVLEADRASRFARVRRLLRPPIVSPTRPLLDGRHRVDWDETPTMNQATSIAHGHVLTFRQTWHADGYSLGDLLYSLPLAPGQRKQIATVDWNRIDAVQRLSAREMRETLAAAIERDRDIAEIVRGALDEHVRAGSRATRGAVGGGLGLAIGPIVLGGGGGSSWASSSAWQDSARTVTGDSLQQVRDRTVQSASASRSQRSTVVQTVRQGESVRAETTIVANYNHCHAMTLQYFEVLRHFQLTHAIVGVSECLFVPFLLSAFDLEKALRWREPLQASLRRRDYQAAFDAAQRVRTNWQNADVPVGAYADDPIQWLDGELTVRIDLPRPKDDADGLFVETNWAPYQHLLTRDPEQEWNLWLGVVTAAERDRVWQRRIAPRIASALFNQLRMSLIRTDQSTVPVPIDATLVSNWRPGSPQLVTFRPAGSLPSITRRDIGGVRFSSGVLVPAPATVVVERGTARYRTAHLHHAFYTDLSIQNDVGTGDDVEIGVRLDKLEKRRPRDDDRRRVAALLDHLNAHLEYYHRSIWLRMHPNRRYLLLDGFEAPNAGGRSVASVVENRIIGVVGNCLVMPLAPGVHLDPQTDIPPEARGDLLAYYASDPPPPVRVSVPTQGVFAEAILGQCNSCEIKDDNRFWRWEEAEIPDKPPELGTVSTASRRRAPTALRPGAFSAPLVGLQSLGDLPAPQALRAALDLIGTPNLFRDLTGVDLNIRHAAQALSSALTTAQFFGGEASKLAKQQFLARNQDRVLKSIEDARKKGLITDEQAKELNTRALGGSVGQKPESEAPKTESGSMQKVLQRVARSKSGRVLVERPTGKVDVRTRTDAASFGYTVTPPVRLVTQTDTALCWAAAGATLMNWRDQTNRSLQQAADELGGNWRAKVDANESLGPSELRAYASALGLVEEGPAAYTPRQIMKMLEDFGPLWVVHDDLAVNNRLVHARIVVGITGEGAGDDAKVTMLDPSGEEVPAEDFGTFAQRLAAGEAVRFGVGILHFPA